MTLFRLVLIGLIVGLLQACANPSIVNVDQSKLSYVEASKIIYVPRFEGNPDFVEESTDYFVSIIEAGSSVSILQASALRSESVDIVSGGNLAPLEVALESARASGADLLIMGKVTSHKTSATLNGFSTVRIYDVKTGERIANFHEPSGLLMAYSEHQSVLAAVKRTAKHVTQLLK